MKAKDKVKLMGKLVLVDSVYYRDIDFSNPEQEKAVWTTESRPPRMGWVVGFRTVYNGINYCDFDSTQFEPSESIRVALVSFWPTTKPVSVPLPLNVLDEKGIKENKGLLYAPGWDPETREKVSDILKADIRKHPDIYPRDEQGRFVK